MERKYSTICTYEVPMSYHFKPEPSWSQLLSKSHSRSRSSLYAPRGAALQGHRRKLTTTTGKMIINWSRVVCPKHYHCAQALYNCARVGIFTPGCRMQRDWATVSTPREKKSTTSRHIIKWDEVFRQGQPCTIILSSHFPIAY